MRFVYLQTQACIDVSIAHISPKSLDDVQEGGFAIKLNPDGTTDIPSPPREVRTFNGRNYVMEEGITGDFALVKAWKGDKDGNLVFRGTTRNFNVDAAKAGRITIAEVEELVEPGEIHPDEIHVPSVFVQRIFKSKNLEKRIERLTLSNSSVRTEMLIYIVSRIERNPVLTGDSLLSLLV